MKTTTAKERRSGVLRGGRGSQLDDRRSSRPWTSPRSVWDGGILYIDRIYRERTRWTTGHVHTHLEIYEAEIEPHFH